MFVPFSIISDHRLRYRSCRLCSSPGLHNLPIKQTEKPNYWIVILPKKYARNYNINKNTTKAGEKFTFLALWMYGICVPLSKQSLMMRRRAHWPARTTPLPWININSLSVVVKAFSLMNTKPLSSFSLSSSCKKITIHKATFKSLVNNVHWDQQI